MLLVGQQEGHPAYKKTNWWGVGMVVCLERGADMHMAQLMPLPLTVSCFSKIQIGSTFLVPAHPGSPGKRTVKRVCVCVCVCVCNFTCSFWTENMCHTAKKSSLDFVVLICLFAVYPSCTDCPSQLLDWTFIRLKPV